MDLKGQHVIVVGLGKSGVSAALLCHERGARVVANDRAPIERWSPQAKALAERGIELVAGTHEGVPFESARLVVVSPGVPPLPELERARERGVEVIGELELASRHYDGDPVVAVGGTNGKSTTTTLIGELLSAAGQKVFTGGNLGRPACEAVDGEFDTIVLEVSSFQLERAPRFRPNVSVLLNITEDHLDRYPSFSAYAEAKGNAFINQTAEDVAVVPFGDAACEQQARRGKGRVVFFGVDGDYVVDGQAVVERATGERFELGATRLFGSHNYLNAAAAIAATRALGLSSDAVRLGLRRFEPLPHRMALAGEIDGVRFYDDSKGTNVGAAVTALRGLSEPKGVLIAGGRDKLGAYEPLVEALREKGRAVVLIGEAAERIAQAVGDALPVRRAKDLKEAVELAFEAAERGDAVLLSPACSSFDMFKSYAERGDRFVEAVAALRAARKGTS